MATWRVARSLDQLLAQINATAPNRSKLSDGSIGDAAHSSRESDHNPDQDGVVCARDFTDDPAHGCDVDAIFRSLVASADPRIKYLIRQFHGSTPTITQWQGGRLVWTPYYGINPHDHHGHVSVTQAGKDDARPWSIGGAAAPALPIPTGSSDEMIILFDNRQAGTLKGRGPYGSTDVALLSGPIYSRYDLADPFIVAALTDAITNRHVPATWVTYPQWHDIETKAAALITAATG